MRAAIYARVSTATGKQNPDNQVHDVTAWAARLGFEVVKVYVDRQSGSTDDRPALQEALQGAHRREYDVLLVAALDRVTRGGAASLAGILDRLGRAGVGIKSLREEWADTASPLVRELLLSIFAWVGKLERSQLVDRIRSGMARARRSGTRSGKAIGRPAKAIDSDQAVRAVAKGGSLRRGAAELGVSVALLRRRLAQATATAAV
jgi:DNA invertase Pin-like site-specific DNA recombinase